VQVLLKHRDTEAQRIWWFLCEAAAALAMGSSGVIRRFLADGSE
jgi:hypothetical protein